MADPRLANQLRKLPLFADLRPKELALLTLVMKDQQCADGDVICRQGEPGDSCFFILRGEVDVIRELGSGHEQHLATLGEGQLFGQIALVDQGPRSATCRARGKCELMRLDASDFEMLFSSGSQFAFRFQTVIALTAVEQLRRANARLNGLLSSADSGETDEELSRLQGLLAEADAANAATEPVSV